MFLCHHDEARLDSVSSRHHLVCLGSTSKRYTRHTGAGKHWEADSKVILITSFDLNVGLSTSSIEIVREEDFLYSFCYFRTLSFPACMARLERK